MLSRRRIALVVTGGVAAYKSAYLARRLIESEAEVRVIMSRSASKFIGSQTFAAITGCKPLTELFDGDEVSPHTELARWADALVVAPATAATLSRAANGLSEDLVSATLLATDKPVLFAPAMHTEMWENPATQRNLSRLKADGHRFVGPSQGELAGGDIGVGRMAEPEEILEAIAEIFGGGSSGISVLVTAGGTREPLDPVRYLGNRSSGKMGHAMADEAARRGHQVTLITTSSLPVSPGVKVLEVQTADEMLDIVAGVETDVAIMTAAVADFKPVNVSDDKLSRSDGLGSIDLTETPDVLASVVARDRRPVVVGFAAETGGVERAIDKARRKDVDLLVYNNVAEEESGFGTDTNRVVLIEPDGSTTELPLLSKAEVASRLWDRVEQILADKR